MWKLCTHLNIILQWILVWRICSSNMIPSGGWLAGGTQNILYVKYATTWDAANYICEQLGASLLRIDDMMTANAVNGFIKTLENEGSYNNGWFGLHWRILTTSNSTERSLVWSDNCCSFDSDRVSNFKEGGHDESNGQELCYRITYDSSWERQYCTDSYNYIFCETRTEPYDTDSYLEDTSHDMVAINKLANETCESSCNQIYGCYRFSPASDNSCIVAIADLDLNSGLSSFWRNRTITTTQHSKSDIDWIILQLGTINLSSTIDTECTPQTQYEIPDGLVDYRSVAFTPEDSNNEVSNTGECNATITIENTLTTTEFSVVTETPEVNVIPTTVVETMTVTDTNLTSVIPTTVVYTTTMTESAETVFVTNTVELNSSCPIEATTSLDNQYPASSTSTTNIEESSSCENTGAVPDTTTVTTTVLNTITDTYTVEETPGVTTATTTLYITEPAATSSCAATETQAVIVATDTVTVTATQMSSTTCPSASQATVTVTTLSISASEICSSSISGGSSSNSTTANSVDMEQFEQEILAEMEVDKTATSKSRRKYSSATDDRTSSQAIGVFAVAFISVIVLTILALDIPTFFMTLRCPTGTVRQ